MSFDRPGLPHPGRKADEAAIDEALAEDGVELADGDLDGLDRPGAVSAGPVPYEPRHPADGPVDGPVDESAQPVDDPAHDDPAHDAG